MATKDKVKGYCKESKCEYDVYTSEKVDELLTNKANTSDVYTKSETKALINSGLIKVETITGSYSRSSGGDTVISTKSVSYPEGFNKDNSILLAIGTRTTGNTNYPDYVFGSTGNEAADKLQAGSTRRMVRFKTNNIELGFSGPQSSDAISVDYKLVIARLVTLE